MSYKDYRDPHSPYCGDPKGTEGDSVVDSIILLIILPVICLVFGAILELMKGAI